MLSVLNIQVKNIGNKSANLSLKVQEQLVDFITTNLSYKNNIQVLYSFTNVYILVNNKIAYKFYLIPICSHEKAFYGEIVDYLCWNCPENPEETPMFV